MPTSERIYVIPPEGEDDPQVVWLLLRAMYGTRLASSMFQMYIQEVMTRFNFKRIRVTVQVYWSKQRRALVVVHGDDFLVAAPAEAHDEIQRFLQDHFSIKAGPRIGPRTLGGKPEGSYLKRRIGYTGNAFTWEADPRHVETL
eukprot:4150544-Amphidinium_carterae.1